MSTNLSNATIVKALGLPSDISTKLATAIGSDYEKTMNQFLTPLVNKIVYQKVDKMTFDNPFKKYDSFPVNYGDTIENIFTELPVGYTFDKDATDPFTKVIPSVKPLYATINYEMQYEETIQDVLMKRACLAENGFMQLINSILETLVTRRSIDEYTATIRMLNNADIYKDGFETIDVSTLADDKAKYQAITNTIVDTAKDFELPSVDNNKLGVMTVSNKADVLLIIKQSLLNKINIDFLSGVFNLSKVDLVSNIIPVRSFKTVSNPTGNAEAVGEDIDFVIIDTKGFDNHVALQDGGMIYNPKGKYTNHFDNLWKIFAFKTYYNARAYKIKFSA